MGPMRLPYFPLHTVLFPHLPLPLHIFEERYRAMARDLVADDSPFGGRFLVSMITDGPEVGGDARGQPIGTICEIRTAERLPDGRWVLLAVGITRAVVRGIDRRGEYAVAEVEPLEEVAGAGAAHLLPTVQDALDRYMETVKRFVAQAASVGRESEEVTNVAASLDEVLKPIRLPDDPVAASYAVGGVLQVELSRKQQLLELPDAESRLRAELSLLRSESRLLADGAMPPVPTADLTFDPN
jgi:Lon protease-like protein